MGVVVVLVLADLAYTPLVRRREVQARREVAPTSTAYMEQARRCGHPVRNYRWVPLSSIAPVAACAIVLAEEEEFFNKGTVS
ncbi:MAG: hypothetical protein ABI910_10675 [Gemmatimonadota bacterium]